MRVTIGCIIIIYCLTGCSEMRVIGNAAVRELRADAVSVNWKTSQPDKQASEEGAKEHARYAAVKVKTFSSIRRGSTDKRKQVKGLWEGHGS